MKAYSMDLRERVVAACDARDGTHEQIAARFSVSVRWIGDLLRRRRQTGSIAPKPHGGGRAAAFDEAASARLRDAVRGRDDATLEELAQAAGVACSAPAVYRALRRLGVTRNKKSRRAAEQDRPGLKAERAAWRAGFAAIDPSRLVFVDESGATTAMDRTHGRCASGKRVDGPVPHGHWTVTTLTAAVRLGGVPEAACPTFVGATDAMAFETYAERCLVPALRPGDIVIMDNLGSHKRPPPIAAIEAAGATVRFLPPYSPCPYPLLQAWRHGFNERLPAFAPGDRRPLRHVVEEILGVGRGSVGPAWLWTRSKSTPTPGPASNSARPTWATAGAPPG